MTEAKMAGGVVREPLQRSIIARPIAGGAVHTVIGPEPGQRGPWPSAGFHVEIIP